MNGADQTQIGPAEHGHEMRCREGKDEVIAHVFHGFGHHLDQITVVLDASGRAAIGPACEQEEQEKSGNETAI